jgi:tRNA uridine 5-carboxymethylaminomethyl modification enzyme
VQATHQIVRANLDRSPLYTGRIKGTGPRYCPSIEDKVVKFFEKTCHQLFLEPEGRHTQEFYVNGISTSLPYDVQLDLVHSIPGLEHAEIMRPGLPSNMILSADPAFPTLETKRVNGSISLASQWHLWGIYEAVAAQGLVAVPMQN